jgi:hypothetical protein
MKLFNLDCHISVIADLKKIFEDLGHSVTSWSISGHNWVFNREPSKVDVINQNTWRGINKNLCDAFYERYKDELSEYDGFICTYPPVFSMLYKKFDKPIIIQVPIRYEMPFFNNKNEWNLFNDYLRKNIDSGKIIATANSEYDKKYFEFFVNRECELIPSICEYTNTQWNPTKDTFLFYSNLYPDIINKEIITHKQSIGKYSWEDISKYQGIILLPYNCSTMSMFEYYTANIPLFCPSIKFMVELFQKYPNHILTDLTWNRIFGMRPKSIIDCDVNNDPNRYDNLEIITKWIEYSDFYNQESMPHIVYFDSFDDMYFKLKTTNLNEVHDRMKKYNETRKIDIYNKWEKILNNL